MAFDHVLNDTGLSNSKPEASVLAVFALGSEADCPSHSVQHLKGLGDQKSIYRGCRAKVIDAIFER
jgi:hypothetical protein